MKKMTKRDMYEAIIGVMQTGETTVNPDDIVAFCQNELELLDKKALKAKERSAAKRSEGDALQDAVLEALSDEEYRTIADIAASIEGEDVTVSRVTYRLNSLVKVGKAAKSEVVVEAVGGGKKRKVVAYKRCD